MGRIRSQIVTSSSNYDEQFDEQFAIVFDAIKQLIADDQDRKTKPKRRIGFLYGKAQQVAAKRDHELGLRGNADFFVIF